MKTNRITGCSAGIGLFALLSAFVAFAAPEPKRDATVVRDYIRKVVGDKTIAEIQKKEGGAAFLKRFFGDREWMEQFAGSGPFGGDQFKRGEEDAAKALAALDLLVWNDKDDFITSTTIGRNAATALALNHGRDWTDEKLVQVMECYREWAEDGTLHDTAWGLDTRQWREIMTFGQNAELSVANLRWIHDFANIPAGRYGGLAWQCSYRLFNCFGASVHGPMYYKPWEHRWNTQELRYRVGGVCGALSKFGSHGAASHGIRSFTAGQPGHCAYMLWNEKGSRWGLAYSVTSHTGSHFSLGGQGFPANEEQDRYYNDPKRMGAEYLRWKGEWEASMRLAHGNWQAASEWLAALKARNAPRAEWDKYATAVCETFGGFPCQGWQLYFPYIESIRAKGEKVEAAKKALLALRESDAKTEEPLYLDEKVLDPLDKMLGSDTDAMWSLFPAMLQGQVKTQSFYRQTVNWAAGRLMPHDSTRYLSIVGQFAKKTGTELDFSGMIRQASEKEDLAMWRQVHSLMERLSPNKKPKASGKAWPKEQYGGTLLSPDGLLKISTTCNWDSPLRYRNTLLAEGFGGNSFHTAKEVSPWAMVVLPGTSEISGVTVVNSGGGQNGGRQVPLKIWTSEDGEKFTEVYSSSSVQDEWKAQFSSPKRAKYIKVGRTPEQREEVFHLQKILVYGKKLY